ncbi:hypothetical protein H4I96_11815 [Botrytis cinerea]
MSNTIESSCIAVQGFATSDPRTTSHNPSNATSSTEAGYLSTQHIQCYLADKDAPVPYALSALPADDNPDKNFDCCVCNEWEVAAVRCNILW